MLNNDTLEVFGKKLSTMKTGSILSGYKLSHPKELEKT